MKSILAKQIIFISLVYVLAKLLWDVIPVNVLPKILQDVINDFLGPSFLLSIILCTFIYFLWRVPILGKLTQCLFGTKRNIQGTWCGRLKYEFEGKKMEKTVFLVIKQADGYSLDIWLLTDERTSSSIFADIVPYRGRERIVYTYSNEESPVNKEKNPSHEGFCQLDIVDNSNGLLGIYYTDRNTFGELRFDKRNRKIAMDFKNAKKLFRP